MDYLTTLLEADPSIGFKTKFPGLSFASSVEFYDFHVYYFAHNKKSLDESTSLRNQFLRDFSEEGKEGAVIVKVLPNDKIIGPHPTQFWEVDVARPEVFVKVLGWFQLHHGNLSVLIHPQTGDDLADHTNHALWLGDKLPLLVDVFAPTPQGVPPYGVKRTTKQ